MEEIIKLLKERILLAEKKKGEYDTLEMDAFWDGQMRCAQDMLNKVSRLTQRAPDAVYCTGCGDEIIPLCPECSGEE